MGGLWGRAVGVLGDGVSVTNCGSGGGGEGDDRVFEEGLGDKVESFGVLPFGWGDLRGGGVLCSHL